MQLNSEAHGPSGWWIHQEPNSVVSKDDVLEGKIISNNISFQTGEEFSRQFLQDRLTPRKIPAVTVTPQNHEQRNGFNKNQERGMVYEEITRILGLKRMDSECGSDITEFASAKGSTSEVDSAACTNQAYGYPKETGDCGHGSRRASGEVNYDSATRPSAPPVNEVESCQFSQPYGLRVSDGSSSGKIKLLCSFGGKILPRPSDGKLRYVGGDTRIISIWKNLSWEELVKKTLGICKQPHTIKYQLPDEDLDALISVSCDEDLQNMIEEYQSLENLAGSQRVRIFLVPSSEFENTCTLDAGSIQQSNADYQYVVAVNGIVDPSLERNMEQILASDIANLKTNLETKGDLVDLHPSQNVNGSQDLVESHIEPSIFSPVPVQQGDSENDCPQFHQDNLFSGNTESNSSFSTAQLLPENTSRDASAYYHPSNGEITSKNYHLPNKVDNIRKPSKPEEVQFQNHVPSKEFVFPPSFDQDDSNVNINTQGRPMLKERSFYSEKPITDLEDPFGLLPGTDDFTGSHNRIPHAFSDSKLQEHGRRSDYCLQEGMSPSSTLSFSKPQLPFQAGSVGLEEKPLEMSESTGFGNPQAQIKLQNVEATVPHRRADFLNSSLGQESFTMNQYSGDNAAGIDDKHQSSLDANRDNFMLENLAVENPRNCDILTGLDEKGSGIHQDGKLPKIWPASSSMEYLNKSSNICFDPATILGISTLSQEFEVFGDNDLASSGNLNPFVDEVMEPSENQHMGKSQRTLKDQPDVLGMVMGDDHKDDISWSNILKVADMFPGSRQQPCNESSLTDLLCGLTDGLAFHESPLLVSGACQNNTILQEPIQESSVDLCPSAVSGNAALDNLHNIAAVKNPNQKSGFKREVSLIDEDFVSFPGQIVENSGILGCCSEMQMVEDFSLNNMNDKNHLDSMVTSQQAAGSFPGMEPSSPNGPQFVDATDGEAISPDATEPGRVLPESDFENFKAGGGDKSELITDAMIAEVEAGIYGLQIIKNDDLEELWELGSGTYGTVYHGKWRGTDVAIKRIKNSCFAGRSSEQERLTKDFWREAHILSTLHHPNVVAFYGVVPDGAGGTLATVTEFMANGSLRNVLLKKDRSLDRRRKLIIAMDAAFGMEYLHSKNIVHFDLKCDNLLVNLRDPQRPICKVGDFGLSRIKRNTLVSGGVRGTLPWMAPELLNGSSSRVSEKVDVFSFGITMWEILTAEEPYANMHCGAIIVTCFHVSWVRRCLISLLKYQQSI
ncbi:uncharacterized protein LOC127786741 isoform X2 [Diospyros lotus]|uniref:uncharacterized protein LOC127786741 isoform X2 n=1 Tax=Diospyros lotus TaxID=55363 RepID=UPI00224C9872|nr:uncharacterized protein LOC127786741 isoform X2 [Diospyros lotus]